MPSVDEAALLELFPIYIIIALPKAGAFHSATAGNVRSVQVMPSVEEVDAVEAVDAPATNILLPKIDSLKPLAIVGNVRNVQVIPSVE
jgi:hypothetical protein